jgi:hypothetical protein
MTTTSAEWLDVAGATRLLGLKSEKALRARVARRQVPFKRLGARIIFSRAELYDFIEKLEGCRVGEAVANATCEGGR